MESGGRLRRLAPAVIETMTVGVALGSLAPLTFAIALAGEGISLAALDIGLVAAFGLAISWLLRRQFRSRVVSAPGAPPDARLDAERATVWRGVRWMLLPAALLALSAEYGGGLEALTLLTVGIVLVVYALRLRRWERQTGQRIYRERRIRAWRGPFFYLAPAEYVRARVPPRTRPLR
jgi:hypothetical protein